MSRYDKYFLRHLLWLQDSFCDYYVQSHWWGRQDILDVAYVIFDWDEDAEYWMAQCADWDRFNTISRLRAFLAADCLTQYQVHRMNDRQVMRTAARELCMNAHRMVIKPKIGWAVWVDPQTQKPVQPIAVESAPDLDGLLDELKIHLDAMVADRQRQTAQLNAKLAEMNAFEKSWELQKRKFKSAPQYLPLRNAVDALRALPDTVKTMGRLLATGGSILEAVSDAVRAGSMEPIQSEIEQAVAPLVETAQQARQATAMVQVLLNDEETYDLLYDFGERYVKAMHPLDIAEYGLKAASVIITLIASIAAMIYTGGTSGAGSAGKLLISIKRLRDASPVVDKIYKALKYMAYRSKLPKLIEKGVSKVKRKRTKNKGKSGVPEVKAPDKIDKNRKKGYSGDDEGPKKTLERKPKQPNTEEIYPPRTDKAIKESNHVVTEMDKVMSKRKNPPTSVITHEDGTVSVGISGEGNAKNIAKAKKLEDHLNKGHESQKYKVSGESMPTEKLKDVPDGNPVAASSEPKAAKAAHDNPSPIDGFDTRWRGKADNPRPYMGKNAGNTPVDKNQMSQCPTCADPKNAKEYMDYANNSEK